MNDESELFNLISPHSCGAVLKRTVKGEGLIVIAESAKLFEMLERLDSVKEFDLKSAALRPFDFADVEKIELFRAESRLVVGVGQSDGVRNISERKLTVAGDYLLTVDTPQLFYPLDFLSDILALKQCKTVPACFQTVTRRPLTGNRKDRTVFLFLPVP